MCYNRLIGVRGRWECYFSYKDENRVGCAISVSRIGWGIRSTALGSKVSWSETFGRNDFSPKLLCTSTANTVVMSADSNYQNFDIATPAVLRVNPDNPPTDAFTVAEAPWSVAEWAVAALRFVNLTIREALH